MELGSVCGWRPLLAPLARCPSPPLVAWPDLSGRAALSNVGRLALSLAPSCLARGFGCDLVWLGVSAPLCLLTSLVCHPR
eukprot:3624952-Alexandrium_andersonii.AAC.1